ncbi:type VII secretion target [Actinokineospora auranticolor]|uniref:Excreted virulence factor EspC (Type VII ESX diderm) n=1 Tax=Actinokineospora auranticolor TaxID=155976 RepID=A0A2S6GZ82_9PSEU|nr:type VII secretion target [Actinokineospora auranticolor]PPK70476.1 excreted virulence factor EspC (type VII ESX diderm) [Actinokineospora auranticolor]
MGTGFNVNVAEMRVHARTVATCSTQVQSATGATQSVSDAAFGMIGQFFATAILAACGDVLQGIQKVATAFDDVRKGIEDVAREYEQIDLGNANTFAGRSA